MPYGLLVSSKVTHDERSCLSNIRHSGFSLYIGLRGLGSFSTGPLRLEKEYGECRSPPRFRNSTFSAHSTPTR
jgi:hypothetical protein